MPETKDLVVLEEHEAYWQIVLNQPAKLNVLSGELLARFSSVLEKINEDETRQVVILTGAGRAFCAGADIKALNKMDENAVAAFISNLVDTFLAVRQSSKIFIAAVNGHAVGGGAELMISCDISIASDSAKIGFPEVKLGLIPGALGTASLASLVGKARAKELMLRGELISSEEAYKIGLINHVVPSDELLSTCVHLAEEIHAKSTIAVEQIKNVVETSGDMGLREALAHERQAFMRCFLSETSAQLRKQFEEKK